jgi:hypothetical protein
MRLDGRRMEKGLRCCSRRMLHARLAQVAGTAQTGVIKETITEQRLAIVDISRATLRQISPPDMYVYEYNWSQDGSRLAVTAAHGNGDNNWYIAQLYTISRR